MAKGLDHDRRAQRDPGSPPDGACAPSTWGGDVEWGRPGEVGAGREFLDAAVVVLGSINGVWGRDLRIDVDASATARDPAVRRHGSWIPDAAMTLRASLRGRPDSGRRRHGEGRCRHRASASWRSWTRSVRQDVAASR